MSALIEDERAYWVALNMAAGIGPVRFQRLLDICGGARGAWEASDLDLAAAGLERRTADSLRRLRQRTSPEAVARRLAQLGIRALTLLDNEYPSNLRQIADAPPVLFVRGRLLAEDSLAVALVGTRRATAYGRAVTERLARDLATAGVTVVSGLAKGVDTAAHVAALEAGGRTLAVLGNGLDQVYPPENGALARRIAEDGRGALVSEFAPGVPPDAVNFPRRNRIISGLSRGVVVVEAAERSGSLITAQYALEQGREIFAVPGSPLDPRAKGANRLIKEGATLTESAEDILSVLAPMLGSGFQEPDRPTTAARSDTMEAEADRIRAAVEEALGPAPVEIDELIRQLSAPPAAVLTVILELELAGRCARHP